MAIMTIERECIRCVRYRARSLYDTTKKGRATTYCAECNKLRAVWGTMKARCYNPKHNRFEYYGGRGIRVCRPWLDFMDNFCQWAVRHGYKEGLQLDREDQDGNYDPINCRWITSAQNNRNKRNGRLTVEKVQKMKKLLNTDHGMTLQQIGDLFGCSHYSVCNIKRQKQWADVLPILPKYETNRATLDEMTVRDIRQLYTNGYTEKQLQNRFNLSRACVYNLIRNKTWVGV